MGYPKHTDAAICLSVLFNDIGKYDEAKKVFEQANQSITIKQASGDLKDLVPRYQTMRGKHVERRFGWDTHGLPAEVEAEKQLGITTKAQIVELGIDKFNDACRSSVLAYT